MGWRLSGGGVAPSHQSRQSVKPQPCISVYSIPNKNHGQGTHVQCKTTLPLPAWHPKPHSEFSVPVIGSFLMASLTTAAMASLRRRRWSELGGDLRQVDMIWYKTDFVLLETEPCYETEPLDMIWSEPCYDPIQITEYDVLQFKKTSDYVGIVPSSDRRAADPCFGGDQIVQVLIFTWDLPSKFLLPNTAVDSPLLICSTQRWCCKIVLPMKSGFAQRLP